MSEIQEHLTDEDLRELRERFEAEDAAQRHEDVKRRAIFPE